MYVRHKHGPQNVSNGSRIPLKSVETPVANRPREATARDPPKSVMQARVPPWRMLRRFCLSGDERVSRQFSESASLFLGVKRKYRVLFFYV